MRFKLATTDIPLNLFAIHWILCSLFFLSGCASLIYQIVWQRMLFTTLGMDLESITVVVSVFMFGLSIGGILGGMIADKMPSRLLTLYIAIELGIALFGGLSADIIAKISGISATNSEIATAGISFLILAFPTILMGMTFPILVTHVYQFDQHIGRSVGRLYFANTLGGALGAYFSGFIFLYSMDLIGVIHQAVFLNIIIAIIAYLFFRKRIS